MSRGIKCSYVFINAVSYIMKEVCIMAVNRHYNSTFFVMTTGFQGDSRCTWSPG